VNARAMPRWGSLALAAVLATACGRATDVTVYEPGVYKGPQDPLLATHATAEHKALLKERFTKGQADR
jgi:predicted outer membrane protein